MKTMLRSIITLLFILLTASTLVEAGKWGRGREGHGGFFRGRGFGHGRGWISRGGLWFNPVIVIGKPGYCCSPCPYPDCDPDYWSRWGKYRRRVVTPTIGAQIGFRFGR